jgi:hypothetical protein
MRSRGVWLFVLLVGWLAAQQNSRETATYVYDGMGNRTLATSSTSARTGSGTQNIERIQSVNGRQIPLDSVQERIISETNGVRVTERIVRRYDAEGRPGPAEKIRIEERKEGDGSTSTSTSVFRGDLNGSYQLAERATEKTSKSGSVTTIMRSVERPTLNATLDVIEKSTRTTIEKDNTSHSEDVTYRRDPSGNFYTASQEVADRKQVRDSTSETVTVFESTPGGKMQFSRQTVTTARIAADGTEHRETDVYNIVVPGQVSSADQDRPQLRERQILERRADSSGAVVETLSVRRPSLSDPNRLGTEQQVSEVICRGCDPPKKP